MSLKISVLHPDSEPTDEQLHELMADALKDVIEEHRISELNYQMAVNKRRELAFAKQRMQLIEENGR